MKMTDYIMMMTKNTVAFYFLILHLCVFYDDDENENDGFIQQLNNESTKYNLN